MDNHPIPQDVTGFQFKLIGNMTVKQFAYLAVGVILAFVFLQLPINFLIKLPLSIFFAILGIGLAFFPISGRPMDAMIGSFIKALFRPTQFVYKKEGKELYFSNRPVLTIKLSKNSFNPLPQDQLKTYLQNQALQKKNKIDEEEDNLLMSIGKLATDNIPVQTFTPPTPIPVTQPPPPTPQAIQSKPIFRPTGMPTAPSAPNLITGIVKDPRGNPLPNILIEVKDKEGSPVRAFKTNEVGRFASATPLLNGTYTIEFEDLKGQNKFEPKTINIIGQIIMPLVIMSIDTREELRRSLFPQP